MFLQVLQPEVLPAGPAQETEPEMHPMVAGRYIAYCHCSTRKIHLLL